MCSTFKGAGRAAMLDRNSTAHLDLRVRYRAADVVPFSPITESHVNDGLTIGELCDAAIRYSDNTAGNLLLDDLGGSGEVTTFARSLGDRVTRLDRREPELDSAVPGDDRDTTSPRAIAAGYRELVLGCRLDEVDRALLTGWLVGNTTGDTRIRADSQRAGGSVTRPAPAITAWSMTSRLPGFWTQRRSCLLCCPHARPWTRRVTTC